MLKTTFFSAPKIDFKYFVIKGWSGLFRVSSEKVKSFFSHFVHSRKMRKFSRNRKCENFAKKCTQKNNAKISQKNGNYAKKHKNFAKNT